MRIDNPFDKKLEASKRIPEHFREALVEAVDTLDFAWAGVQAVFANRANVEHALTLLPILLARADAARLRAEREAAPGRATEP